MLYNDFSTNLLGLKGINISSVEEDEFLLTINADTIPREHKCPSCDNVTKYVYDYRKQKIKDLRLRGKPVLLILKKRRLKEFMKT